MIRIKEIFIDIIKDITEIPNSVKFWNFVVLISLFLLGLYDINWLIVALCVGSILAIAIVIDNVENNHYWILFMPITWIIGIIMACAGIVFLGIRVIIIPFNDWLNSLNKKDDTRNI